MFKIAIEGVPPGNEWYGSEWTTADQAVALRALVAIARSIEGNANPSIKLTFEGPGFEREIIALDTAKSYDYLLGDRD